MSNHGLSSFVIVSPDPQRTASFLTNVLGATTVHREWGLEVALPGGPAGQIWLKDLTPHGVPTGWFPQFHADPIGPPIARAIAAGAEILSPVEMGPHGVTCLLVTAAGLPFGLEARPANDRSAEPTGVCWVEWEVDDVKASVSFWTSVLDVKFHLDPSGNSAFSEHGGAVIGLGIRGAVDAPSAGYLHVQVANLEERLRDVTADGGAVDPPVAVEGVGRAARVRDAAGVGFYLFSPG